ncbi:MAG TPA: hypothetical protein VM509_01635 [Planctomycetota bacterium]|nr:hypothetical protein [Planctomycetota bacterium]
MTKRRWLGRVLLALGVVVLVDVTLSLTWLRDGRVGKRPLPPFGVEFDEAQLAILARLAEGETNPGAVTGFDRELGWCVRPGAVHKDSIHVNSRGQRGVREYGAVPAPGALRVACYGDSFVFGDEVPDEYTFQAFLERQAPSVEALNYGVPAYGTDQALLRLRRDGIANARVVVIGLLLENIGRNVNRYRPLWTPRTLSPFSKPRFVLAPDISGVEKLQLVPQPYATPRELALAALDGRILVALAEHEHWRGRPEVATGKWSSLVRLAAGWLAYRERDPRRLWLEQGGEPRRVTLALIEALRDEARAQGAKEVLVLVLPMREELDDYRKTGQAYWTQAVTDLTARGIACIDLVPELAAADARCETDPAHPGLYVAAHFSSVGNEVIALAIERWLVENHLLLPTPLRK